MPHPEVPRRHVKQADLNRQVFVCNGKSCTARGSDKVKDCFKEVLNERDILFGKPEKANPAGSVVLTDCSSVGFCDCGPAVLVYPDGVWYQEVKPEDVAEIVDSHLIGNKPVERLIGRQIPSQHG
jgi:(2Fe-2S) ferredoxin